MPIGIKLDAVQQNQPNGQQGLAVDYIETTLHDQRSPTETFAWDQSTATRYLNVAYCDYPTAVPQILGYADYDPTNNPNRKFYRWLPEYHPRFPFLYATKIGSGKGVGVHRGAGSTIRNPIRTSPQLFTGTPTLQYDTINGKKVGRSEQAELRVEYEALDYPVLTDNQITYEYQRYVSYKWHPNADYLSLPVQSLPFKWSTGDEKGIGLPTQANPQGAPFNYGPAPSGGTAYPNSIGKLVTTIDFVFTWYQVPYFGLPFGAILGSIGTVNQDTFNFFNNFPMPYGTLLLVSADLKRIKAPFLQPSTQAQYGGGSFYWQVEYQMRFNINKHNNFFDFSPADSSTPRGWFQITVDGTLVKGPSWPAGKTVFDGTDFNALFQGA